MKTRHLLTFTFLLLSSAAVFGQQCSLNDAFQEASRFMQKVNPDANLTHQNIRKTQAANKDYSIQPYYIFNAENEKGFIIVSGIDSEILGYSDKGNLDADNMPLEMKALLSTYDQQISTAKKLQLKVSKNTVSRQNILLTTASWGQSSPYNNNLSMNGRTALVGCASTATAILMKYHEWPKAPSKVIPGYVNNSSNTSGGITETLPDLAIVDFDWDNMLDSYGSGSYWGGSTGTATQKAAVALLNQYVSQALHSDYGTSGTNAYLYAPALGLRDYFGYDPGLRLERPFDYTKTQWENLIYNELKNGRPVFYSGLAGQAGNETSGHGFVCDGYQQRNGDSFFHINWGWNGSDDGYFKLSLLSAQSQQYSTTKYEYSIHQEAIIGIQKPTAQSKAVVDQNLTIEGLSTTQQGAVSLTCYNNRPAYFNIAWGIIDEDGNILESINVSENEKQLSAETTYSVSGDLSSVASKPDGIYRIVPISQRVRSTYIEDEGTDWMPLAGWKRFYINAHVKNGAVTYVTHPAIEMWDAEGNMTYKEYAPQTSPTYVDNMPTTYTVDDDVAVINLYDVDFNETEVTPSQNADCLYFVKKYDAITDVSDEQTSEEYVPNLLGTNVIRGFVDYNKIFGGGEAVPGDINGDSVVDISDLALLVNYILGKDTDSNKAKACDVNGNGTVDIADVTTLVNIILGK